jgi:site-specific DNA-methyltransferase (adenine-specific)
VTERIVVASKGRFDRALSSKVRQRKGLPSEASIFKDEFMEATVDLWDIQPESATRVNHPAPFPVELPQRLIELYTYKDDLVLDPFMGSGSTAVASLRSARHFIGYDTEPDYVSAARRRVDEARDALAAEEARRRRRLEAPARPEAADADEPFQSRAVKEGQRAKEIALELLEACGFRDIVPDRRFGSGVEVNFVAKDARGRKWFFDVSGAFTSSRPGLRRTDTLWKALGKAAVLKAAKVGQHRLILLTTDLPPKASAGYLALKAARPEIFHDAIEMLSVEGRERLRSYAAGEGYKEPLGELLVSESRGA